MQGNSMARELEVACLLARQAGEIARKYYREGVQVEYKNNDHTNPVTQADKDANTLICAGLEAAFPGDAILAEESVPDPSRHSNRRLWCVDPIDGTRDFVDRTGQFVVMIGLAIEQKATLGVVYQPTEDILWWGYGQTARVESATATHDVRVSATTNPKLSTLVTSRVHHSRGLDLFTSGLGIARRMAVGSVGLKIAKLVEQHADIYLSFSSQMHEWDACAPEAIVRAAGGMMTDVTGAPLRYNQPQTTLARGILASNPTLHPQCVQAIAPYLTGRGW